MREYAKISPTFWISLEGKKIKRAGLEAQLVALYLLTNPSANMIGVYYLPLTLIAHETGQPLEEASKALLSLCEVGFCSYDEDHEYVWVHDMGFSQIAKHLKPNDNLVKAVNELYDMLPELPFLPSFYKRYAQAFHLLNKRVFLSPIEAPSEALRSQEQEKEQEQEQEQDNYIMENEKLMCNEKQSELPASTIAISLQNDKLFEVTTQQVQEWQGRYPTVNVIQSLQRNAQWSQENHDKRKTLKTILNHLEYWLDNEQKKNSNPTLLKPHLSNLTHHNQHVVASWAMTDAAAGVNYASE